MSEKNRNTNWGKAIAASIGMMSVCAVAIILKKPEALLGLIGVVIVVSWLD